MASFYPFFIFILTTPKRSMIATTPKPSAQNTEGFNASKKVGGDTFSLE